MTTKRLQTTPHTGLEYPECNRDPLSNATRHNIIINMDALVRVSITLLLSRILEFSVTQNTTDLNSAFTRDNESLVDLFGNPNLTVHENSTALDVEIVSTVPTVVGTTDDGRYFSTQSTTEYEPLSISPRQETLPLPLSGSLPPPVTDVSKICPCNQMKDKCDPNCCCDPECSEELVLFTSCTVETVSGEPRLCSQEVATYSISETIDGYAQVKTSVQQQVNLDVFCIHSTNYEASLSLATPEIPTVGNFEGLYKSFVQFIFGSASDGATSPTGEPLTSSRYLYGDVIETEEENGGRGFFRLPAPSVTTQCSDLNPAAFLKDQSSRCMQRLVLEQDCTTLKALNMRSYTDLRLRSMNSNDAAVLSVEVVSVSLQSLEGTQTQLNLTGNPSMDPFLLAPEAPNSAVCNNVVLQVGYSFTYSEAGDIVKVTASLVLGAIDHNMVPMEQEFKIIFIQENVEDVPSSSGNPGYVVGLPLLAGTKTADGIVQSADSRGALNLLHGSKNPDCLRGPHQRSPVLFGVNMVSGCTLSLDDTANCTVISELILGVLRGQGFPQYVASFGNSPPQNLKDWVPIRNQTKPMQEVQSCSIPLSLHLEVQWTQYGSLVNPQAQIISVMEVIQTNTSNLVLLSGGSRTISVTTSVTFIPMSAAARPGFKALPTIQAKLPYDFFFPFV
ncbi:tectonic-1 isoform X1 [Esox lucius]|uniref:Tectonic domain-containing protein n=1 Tax=Esox lucius TaxID=8010 RepID=A0A3P9ANM0_ESOLU|nr:tectonic-1 isoform X1 [Esox lucius]